MEEKNYIENDHSFQGCSSRNDFFSTYLQKVRKIHLSTKKNIPDSPQTQSTDPSERGTRKDHFTNLIPIPSTKHPAD